MDARLHRAHSSDELDLFTPPVMSIDDFVFSPPQLSLKPVTQLDNNNYLPSRMSADTQTQSDKKSPPDVTTVGPPPPPVPPKHRKHKKSSTVTPRVPNAPKTDTFRAVKNYEPQHFSHSGRQQLELPLKEGDLVRVLGG